ncbi:flagellar rod assembly protein/muramidase FlgJ [Acidocella sp. MX-AZ02]|nr:flagellar rod assembly protein/muramidase FlgJ [Acidocella sp. MX-AZ02]
MMIEARTALNAANPAPTRPTQKEAMQHLTGLLWYQMLSTLNETGMDASTLGQGGSDFQSMFLWNLAQNDFGKYDARLLQAAQRQIGGQALQTPAPTASTASVLAAMGVPAPVNETPLAPAPQPTPGSEQELDQATNFAKSIWPQITAAAQALGVPAVAVLAQTALETGWGAAAPGHNLFGIKAGPGQAGSLRATHEMQNGVAVAQDAAFRDYADPTASVSDYVGLIQSNYQNATGQGSVAGFAQALQAGGYATDDQYAEKIMKIAQSPLMSAVLQSVGASSSNSGAQP